MVNRNLQRILWPIALLGLATLPSCSQKEKATAQNTPPNVLLIVLDTVRADYVSCYGHPKLTTPNLDRLAQEGVRFNRTFSTDCWTLPSHASLFTGLYPSEAEATAITNQLAERNLTLAERLQDAGYRTGAIVYNAWISKERGFAQGFDDYTEMWRKEYRPTGDELRYGGEQNGVERVVKWIDNWRADNAEGRKKPFMLFANFNIAHLPYTPPPDIRFRFQPKEGVDEVQVQRLMRVVGMWPHVAGLLTLNDSDYAILSQLYEAELWRADNYVGQILKALDERSLTDNTLVIVTSDHGENLGDHGMIDHLLSMYDSTIHVPLIMRFPERIKPGSVNNELTSLVDVVPTVMDICGLAERGEGTMPDAFVNPKLSLLHADRLKRNFIYAENERPMNGISLLKQNAPEFDTSAIDCPMLVIRSDQYKLIWHEGKKVEVFDLQNDPGELVDIAESKPELRDELMGQLKSWMASLTPGGTTTTMESTDTESIDRLRSLGYVK